MSWNGQVLLCRLEPSRSAKGVAQLAVPMSLAEMDWMPERDLRALLLREFVHACDAPGVPHTPLSAAICELDMWVFPSFVAEDKDCVGVLTARA